MIKTITAVLLSASLAGCAVVAPVNKDGSIGKFSIDREESNRILLTAIVDQVNTEYQKRCYETMKVGRTAPGGTVITHYVDQNVRDKC